MHPRAALIIAAAVVSATACGSDDSTTPTPPTVSKIVNFTATLTPSGEVGATLAGNPTGSGTFTATLDTSTNVLTYQVTYTGLTSNVTLGHIHGPFTLGGTANTAAVILNFDPSAAGPAGAANPLASGSAFAKGATSGTANGTVTLAATVPLSTTVNGDSLKKLMLAGLTYANIHTSSNGGGEVRGQITRK